MYRTASLRCGGGPAADADAGSEVDHLAVLGTSDHDEGDRAGVPAGGTEQGRFLGPRHEQGELRDQIIEAYRIGQSAAQRLHAGGQVPAPVRMPVSAMGGPLPRTGVR